jgi:hypothetical protein
MAEAGAGNFSTDRLFAKTTHVCLPRDRMITTAFMDRRRRKEESDMIIRQITETWIESQRRVGCLIGRFCLP